MPHPDKLEMCNCKNIRSGVVIASFKWVVLIKAINPILHCAYQIISDKTQQFWGMNVIIMQERETPSHISLLSS